MSISPPRFRRTESWIFVLAGALYALSCASPGRPDGDTGVGAAREGAPAAATARAATARAAAARPPGARRGAAVPSWSVRAEPAVAPRREAAAAGQRWERIDRHGRHQHRHGRHRQRGQHRNRRRHRRRRRLGLGNRRRASHHPRHRPVRRADRRQRGRRHRRLQQMEDRPGHQRWRARLPARAPAELLGRRRQLQRTRRGSPTDVAGRLRQRPEHLRQPLEVRAAVPRQPRAHELVHRPRRHGARHRRRHRRRRGHGLRADHGRQALGRSGDALDHLPRRRQDAHRAHLAVRGRREPQPRPHLGRSVGRVGHQHLLLRAGLLPRLRTGRQHGVQLEDGHRHLLHGHLGHAERPERQHPERPGPGLVDAGRRAHDAAGDQHAALPPARLLPDAVPPGPGLLLERRAARAHLPAEAHRLLFGASAWRTWSTATTSTARRTRSS